MSADAALDRGTFLMFTITSVANKFIAEIRETAPTRYADVLRFMECTPVEPAPDFVCTFTRGAPITDVEYRDAVDYLLFEAGMYALVESARRIRLNAVDNQFTVVYLGEGE